MSAGNIFLEDIGQDTGTTLHQGPAVNAAGPSSGNAERYAPLFAEQPDPAFDPVYIPEVLLDANQDMSMAVQRVEDSVLEMHEWLKGIRNPKETDWDDARRYYEMLFEQDFDENRKKSINLRDRRFPTDEMDPERASISLPICQEAEKLLEANIYRALRGNGMDYTETLGWERNDQQSAENASKILNYQQHYEIPSPELFSDFINGALVEGTGIWIQTFDPLFNRRKCFVPDRRMVWFDNQAHLQDCRVITWRRHISLGELIRLRSANVLGFTDDSLRAVKDIRIDEQNDLFHDGQKNFKFDFDFDTSNAAKINPAYKRYTLDIHMDTEPWRWVYVLNEALVVGIRGPSIPDAPQQHGPARFPVSTYTPVRRKGDIDGDSVVARLMTSQDLANSAIALLTSNLKNNTLGVPITNQSDMEGKQLEAGVWHYAPDPRAVHNMQFPDITQPVINFVEYIRNRVSDPSSGATPSLRGQAAFSGMTATATRDLLNESQTRIAEMFDLGIYATQDIYSVALILNSLYMEPLAAVRVLGDGQQWMSATPDAFTGVTGKDLVPSGFIGGKSQLTFETLNEAAVVQQTGGDPRPLMKQYFKFKYGRLIDIDAMYPQNGIGNDPIQENANLKLGMPVEMDPDDNDTWHLKAHMLLEQDQDWLAIIQENPALEIQRQTHMRNHLERLLQFQAQFAAVSGGGIGAAGTNLQQPRAKPKSDEDREAQMRGEEG